MTWWLIGAGLLCYFCGVVTGYFWATGAGDVDDGPMFPDPQEMSGITDAMRGVPDNRKTATKSRMERRR